MTENYTTETRTWLEKRFKLEEGQLYRAHQPIYGVEQHTEHSEPNHLWRLAKTVQLMRVLARLKFNTYLDLGAAEGYTAGLVKQLYGAKAFVADLSCEAMCRARQIFGIPGVALNASRLPFKDNAFDVVLCAETIEHLEHPYEMLLEAARVARSALIVSTVEARATYGAARLSLHLLPIDGPHRHRSAWTRRDFEVMFGACVETSTQHLKKRWRQDEPKKWLHHVAVPPPPPPLGEGIVALRVFDSSSRLQDPRVKDEDIIDAAMAFKVDLVPFELPPQDAALDDDLLAALQCPACSGALSLGGQALKCDNCSEIYELQDHVPDLFWPEPADIELLARQPKLGSDSTPEARVQWARKRSRQFDTARHVKNRSMKRLIKRTIRFLERLGSRNG